MDHIGIDVHKKESQLCILAEGGELIERRVRTEPDRLAARSANSRAENLARQIFFTVTFVKGSKTRSTSPASDRASPDRQSRLVEAPAGSAFGSEPDLGGLSWPGEPRPHDLQGCFGLA